MSDFLTIINRVIAEHQLIRGNVKAAEGSVNDMEALFTLRTAHSGWSQSATNRLIEQQNQLRQAMNNLQERLRKHFAFEEDALPPIFGEVLMQALLKAHNNLRKKIEDAKITLDNTKLEGLNQPELLTRKSEIEQTVNQLAEEIEKHAGHEDVVLKMMKESLEAEAKKS
ncbi:MAG: hypothetical protein V1767_08620 [Chloroflexota bacterium]